MQFDRIEEHLAKCDIVIASTAAPHYVIETYQVTRALDTRRNRSLFLIDLSVPRNINPAVSSIDGAYLYNVDDLQQVADANLGLRQQKAQSAETIVQREDRTPKLNRIAKTAKIKREQYAYLFYFLQGSKVTGENSTLIYFSRVA